MLKISKDLSLPIDFVTKTCAILAQRRKGKTYTASVLAEEMVAAGSPFVALDPTGAWWGLRASADGSRAGLPVIVLGGRHGDLPLERTAGKFVADLVVEQPSFYVIDFSAFESAEAERQFATEFGERLYRRKAQPGADFPLHLFVDEADKFIPQQSPSGDKRMLGAFETIVRRGGLRGLGTTLISQRSAVVNKNVLEQIDILIALRTVGPNDREAIDTYVKSQGSPEQRKELMGSLSSLELGEAWVWEPGEDPPTFARVRIRERKTFNSSATPKAGEQRIEPKKLAQVDVEAIKARMADTIARAKADDPAELRRQIVELKRNLEAEKSRRGESVQQRVIEKIVERPVFGPDDIARLESATLELQAATKRAKEIAIAPLLRATIEPRAGGAADPSAATGDSVTVPSAPPGNSDAKTDRILLVIATLKARHIPVTKEAIARWLGIHPNGGRFNRDLAALRARGALAAGFDPTNMIVRGDSRGIDGVKAALKQQTQRRIIERLNYGPDRRSKEELAAELGIHPNGGRFNRDLAWLRAMGVITSKGPIELTSGAFE